MAISFELAILYAQIAVFEPHIENPFNNWSQRHYEQGFSWRPGSVSFGTLDDSGSAEVHVTHGPDFVLSPQSVRAIAVPFQVTSLRGVIVAGIGDEREVSVPPGSYSLAYEAWLPGPELMRIRLTFVESVEVEPRVLVADKGLNPEYPLLMAARPAA